MDNDLATLVEERQSRVEGRMDKMMEATNALRENYDSLLPRWKGVVLTAVSVRVIFNLACYIKVSLSIHRHK